MINKYWACISIVCIQWALASELQIRYQDFEPNDPVIITELVKIRAKDLRAHGITPIKIMIDNPAAVDQEYVMRQPMIPSDQLHNRLRYGSTISPAKFGGILVITSILMTLGYLYYTGLWDALLKKIVDLSQKYGSVTIDTLPSCYTDSFNAIKAVFEQYHGRPVKSFSPVKSALFSAVVYGIPVGMYANSIYTKNNQLQIFLEAHTLATTTSIPAGASITKIMFLNSAQKG